MQQIVWPWPCMKRMIFLPCIHHSEKTYSWPASACLTSEDILKGMHRQVHLVEGRKATNFGSIWRSVQPTFTRKASSTLPVQKMCISLRSGSPTIFANFRALAVYLISNRLNCFNLQRHLSAQSEAEVRQTLHNQDFHCMHHECKGSVWTCNLA